MTNEMTQNPHVHALRELTGNSHYRYECVKCGARFHRKPKGASMAPAQPTR
jgi:hypothetical protein